MTAKKPSELARAKLTRRAKEIITLSNNTVPKRLQKTPSQKRSEAMRKRYLNRAGCITPIHYDSEDLEVPLYCTRHRTESGRHAQVRILKQPDKPISPTPTVILLCPSRKCHKRKDIPQEQWKLGEPVLCSCGRKMLYHKMSNE
jgi:hypothetical protein